MSAAAEGFRAGATVEAYHADPAPGPSLSASLAEALIGQSPRHAWTRSPRLNPAGHEPLDAMDSQKRLRLEHGAALHRLVLGAGADIRWIDADDYRNKQAKEARDAARAAGEIPVLAAHGDKLARIADAARAQALAHDELGPVLRGGGVAETVALWAEAPTGVLPGAAPPPDGAVWCRALVDFIPADEDLPAVDWKFTSTSTAPHSYQRAVQGMALRAHHYRRGLERCGGARRGAAGMLVAAVEMEEPHGLSVFRPGTSLAHLGRELWKEAVATWAACLGAGGHAAAWPLYPARTVEVGADPWMIGRAEDERFAREEAWRLRAERTEGMDPARRRRLMAETGGPVA